jgi:hypothetical protein
MNHVAKILQEFVKTARKWNDLTLDEQRKYLKRHPGSKRRLTGQNKTKVKALETAKGIKTLFRHIKKLDTMTSILEKKNSPDIKRHKIFWKLEKALDGNLPKGNDPYNFTQGNDRWLTPKDKARNKKVTNRLNRQISRIADAYDNLETSKDMKQAVLDYAKKHYLVEQKVKVPVSAEAVKKEPKKPKVKKGKTPDWISVGHRVRLNNGVEMTVTSIKHGHKWVTVNGVTDEGAHWHAKQRGSGYGHMKYLGETSKKEKEKRLKNHYDYTKTIRDDQYRDTNEGRKKLEDLGVQVGSEVTIKGSYPWTARVVEVDYRKGGVRIDQIRTRRQRPSYWGLGGPARPVTQHYRFIPAKFILSAKKGD